jgi:Holliday junction DNA helicase RuvA
MFDYFCGIIAELTPTYLSIEINGIAYMVHITLNTYSNLKAESKEKIFVHQIIREDAHLLYGFKEKKEREIFKILLSVSGIGANTARMILSSMTSDEVTNAIATENIHALQNIKGIGTKTAQRMVIELKDKIVKAHSNNQIFTPEYNTTLEEALSALVMLGFQKSQVEKALTTITRDQKGLTIEELIKKALKVL